MLLHLECLLLFRIIGVSISLYSVLDMDYYCMCILHITMEFIKKFNNAGKVVILINSNTSATIPKLKTEFAFRTRGGALPRPKGRKAPLSRNSSVKVECIASFFSCNKLQVCREIRKYIWPHGSHY